MRWLFLAALLTACSDDTDPQGGRDTASDTTADTISDTADSADPADTTPDVEVLAGPPRLAERAHLEVRLVAHLHSAFSHDGCDEQGLDAEGNPNRACIARMKRALCSERIGHVYMTDHPAHMREQVWTDLFYAEPPRDEVLLSEDGSPWAARFACDAGEGGPDGKVTLMVGYEGTHSMPLGLRRQVDWERHHTFDDLASTESLDAYTAAVAEAGGHVAIAHSEDDDLSATTIIAHDVAAMEFYNFHANFQEVLGGGLGDALFSLEHFLAPEASLPDPDLTALILFGSYPEAALTKWRAVSAARPITAFAGADAHENVSFPAGCKDTNICDGLAEMYPNLVNYLKVGGPVWQADGERLDGYARVFRWAQNRVFVPSAEASDPLAVERAFLAGRAAVVFAVLGDADDYALIASSADGEYADLGQTIEATTGLTLWARSPSVPRPMPFADWTDGSPAELITILWRSDEDGSHEVARWTEPGTWQRFDDLAPGAYQLEVLITPHHLAASLGPAEALAAGTYRWIETNAIRIESAGR